MRTSRTLTVFQLETPPRKIGAPRKIGDPPEKLETPPEKLKTPPGKIGDTPPPKYWRHPPLEKLETPPKNWRPPTVDRITDACKNITLAKTSFQPVKIKRMHSSRMHTACLLTVSQHALLGGCTCLGGVPAQGGGVPAWGCSCLGGVPAWGVPAGDVPAAGCT